MSQAFCKPAAPPPSGQQNHRLWLALLLIGGSLALPLQGQSKLPPQSLEEQGIREKIHQRAEFAISESRFHNPGERIFLLRLNAYVYYSLNPHWELGIGQELSIGNYAGLYLGFIPAFRNQELAYLLRGNYCLNPEAAVRHSISLGVGMGMAKNYQVSADDHAEGNWASLFSGRYAVSFWPRAKNYASLFVQYDVEPKLRAGRRNNWVLGLSIPMAEKKQKGRIATPESEEN